MYFLLRGKKPRLIKKKRKGEKLNNTSFYVVPYPADTVLLESQ